MRPNWLDGVMSATVAVVGDRRANAEDLLGRLGPVERHGVVTFSEAEGLQGSFYEDGTSESRAVFQLHSVSGRGFAWWGLPEPNGYRMSDTKTLLALAGGSEAVSVFWNVNSDMRVLRVEDGRILAAFDPLLEPDRVPADGRDLPFGVENPRAASLSLLERWTGVAISQVWFATPKVTFIVERQATHHHQHRASTRAQTHTPQRRGVPKDHALLRGRRCQTLGLSSGRRPGFKPTD